MSYALSACTFFGRLRGRPGPRRRTGGMASRRASKTRLSWTFAAVNRTTRGTPPRSTTTCRFVPGLPRSVGLGPDSAPRRRAGTVALSQARLQSICPASWRRLSNPWWSLSHTPASCQSRSRLQHVIPLSASEFLREHLPWNAGAKHEPDPAEDGASGDTRSPTF